MRARQLVPVLGFAALAACGFAPRGAADLDAGDDEAPDAAADAAGPDADSDGDRDGVDDATDNCPGVANPAPQRDHDGDGRGDPCDPCPQRPADETGGDGDGDGVGDACDPRPGQRDRIALFEGFYDNPASWSFIGTWAHDPAGFIGRAAPTAEAAFALAPTGFALPYQVETGVVIDALNATLGTARHAGVVFAAAPGTAGFYMCSVRDDNGTGMPARAVIMRFDGLDTQGENATTNLADDLSPGAAVRVRGGHGADSQDCLGVLAGTSARPTLASAVNPGDRIGVRTFGVAARFDYLIVYQPAP